MINIQKVAEGHKFNVIKENGSMSPLSSPTTTPNQASRGKAGDWASSIHTNRKQPVTWTHRQGGELNDFEILPHIWYKTRQINYKLN